MAKKFTEQGTQKLRICRNKRKLDGFGIELGSPKRSRQNLNQKLEDKSNKGEIFKCDVCDKKYKTSGALNLHFTSLHSGNTFKCDICPSRFTQKGYLKTHIESIHNGNTFKCDICPSSFTQKK